MKTACQEAGKFVLRAGVAIILLFHGVHKILRPEQMDMPLMVVEKWGLPTFFAYGVLVGEALAPALLLLGLWSRLAASLVAVNMLVVIFGAHPELVLAIGEFGYALELPALLLSGALASALIGPGRYSLDDWIARRRRV
jgi:putative oxidoreductase